MHLTTMKHALPSWGTVLGGTMDLHGTNISLACFHGINFKSKSWALFSLKEPCISFATEAQEVESKEGEYKRSRRNQRDLSVNRIRGLKLPLEAANSERNLKKMLIRFHWRKFGASGASGASRCMLSFDADVVCSCLL